jgi:hypothetical protein
VLDRQPAITGDPNNARDPTRGTRPAGGLSTPGESRPLIPRGCWWHGPPQPHVGLASNATPCSRAYCGRSPHEGTEERGKRPAHTAAEAGEARATGQIERGIPYRVRIVWPPRSDHRAMCGRSGIATTFGLRSKGLLKIACLGPWRSCSQQTFVFKKWRSRFKLTWHGRLPPAGYCRRLGER